MKRPIVPFFISHRGCPHCCIFCDQFRIAGGGGLPTADEVIDKVETWRKQSRAPVDVAFYGGSFTALPHVEQEKLLAPLQSMIAAGEVVSVRVSTRPDAIDPATASFLKDMGVATVELGIQSLDEQVLSLAERGHSAQDVEDAFGVLHGAGLCIGAQLMPGLPGDTPAKSISTLERVLQLRPAFLRIYPTVVLSGTRLADMFMAGSYQPLTLESGISLCKSLLRRSLAAGFPVIRLGLQPTEDLSRGGEVLAGPYHPAFRQLVDSSLHFDLLERLVDGITGESLTVSCHPGRVSDLIGQRRQNVRLLESRHPVRVARILPDELLAPYEVAIDFSGGRRQGNALQEPADAPRSFSLCPAGIAGGGNSV